MVSRTQEDAMYDDPYLREAQDNFRKLSCNAYPGRGIIAGLNKTGTHLVQIYWIMGRSPNSRNRRFKYNGARLYTEAADPAKMKDPSLVIYDAMLESGRHYVVSNGDQTNTVAEGLESEQPVLSRLLGGRMHEPDEPNFTQRITAMSSLIVGGGACVQMSILRKSRFGPGSDEATYCYTYLQPGLGFCITTYAGDGVPLPPFYGEPSLMPVRGTIDEIGRMYWHALDEENRVSLAVKFIECGNGGSEIFIINKY